MQYLKPHLSFEQQADMLLNKGLTAERDELLERLRDIGYYRMSAYTHPYRMRDAHGGVMSSFIPGTTLDVVMLHYRFDRQLRLLLLDAIERVEVALRSMIANLHTAQNGPFSYADASYFPHWSGYIQQLEKVRIRRDANGQLIYRGEEYVDHFFTKYGDSHEYLPLWMAVGVIEMGTLVYMFVHSSEIIRQRIADAWQTDRNALTSWLHALRGLRNLCAHHARVWNRQFMFPPKIPSFAHDKRWHLMYSEKASKWVKPTHSLSSPTLAQTSTQVASLIFICRLLMHRIAPHSHWAERMQHLLLNAESAGINLRKMGLPPHWELHPLWILS